MRWVGNVQLKGTAVHEESASLRERPDDCNNKTEEMILHKMQEFTFGD